MKVRFLIIAFLFLSLPAISQRVHLISIDELNNRISKGGDTTYVINFWATWCGPCVKELPSFEELNKYSVTRKLKVLLVSVDFKTKLNSSVIPFAKRKKMMSEVLLLNEKNQQEYIDRIDKSWSGAIPATLFVKGSKRTFFEKDFTYTELLKEYQNIQ